MSAASVYNIYRLAVLPHHPLPPKFGPYAEVLMTTLNLLYTVSWRIRIFNCIEEVPRFFFSIEFNSAFQISNYLQLNSTPYTI
jgi:hypothetical protein